MNAHNILYSATGRYMDGQRVTGYHLVGNDGSQHPVSKERVIYLIGKGLVTNLRIQVGADNEVIIRGKGVNLNTLPVFDQNKQQFRNNEASQSAANSKVSVKKSTVANASTMGQYKIVKRIMFKNSCLGYELKNYGGETIRMERKKVIDLAIQKLISNAVVRKSLKDGETAPTLILRGVDCDLSKLPILIVTDNGKIIDPAVEVSGLTVRSAYMKHSGIVRDNANNRTITFKAGDFIICGANGEIKIVNRLDVEKDYTKDTNSGSATCDNYLNMLSSYSIEIFGSKPVQLTQQMIKSWVILKCKKAA